MERHADRRFPARALSVHHQIAQQQDGQLAFADERRALPLKPNAVKHAQRLLGHRPRIKRRPFRPLVPEPREQQQLLVHRREPRRLPRHHIQQLALLAFAQLGLPQQPRPAENRRQRRAHLVRQRVNERLPFLRLRAKRRLPLADCPAHAGKRANQRADFVVLRRRQRRVVFSPGQPRRRGGKLPERPGQQAGYPRRQRHGQRRSQQDDQRRAPHQRPPERIDGRNVERRQQQHAVAQRVGDQQPFARPIQQRGARRRVQQFGQLLCLRQRFPRDRLPVPKQIDGHFL